MASNGKKSNKSISSAGDSPVSLSALPASNSPKKMSDGSGLNSSGAFAWYDPGSSSWRTYQACFITEWEMYSGGFPRAGTMQSGRLYLRHSLVPPTFAQEFFSLGPPITWNTPCARDYKGYTMRYGESVCNQLREIWPDTSGAPHPEFVEEILGFPLGWTDLED